MFTWTNAEALSIVWPIEQLCRLRWRPWDWAQQEKKEQWCKGQTYKAKHASDETGYVENRKRAFCELDEWAGKSVSGRSWCVQRFWKCLACKVVVFSISKFHQAALTQSPVYISSSFTCLIFFRLQVHVGQHLCRENNMPNLKYIGQHSRLRMHLDFNKMMAQKTIIKLFGANVCLEVQDQFSAAVKKIKKNVKTCKTICKHTKSKIW